MRMSMKTHQIRAHHGMCLAFFQGKGYSDEFTAHMRRIKSDLEGNPQVCIINETDDICTHCANNLSGNCETPEKVAGYDNKVLELCQLETGTELAWNDFERLVKSNILDMGKRKEICGDCQWDALCNHIN